MSTRWSGATEIDCTEPGTVRQWLGRWRSPARSDGPRAHHFGTWSPTRDCRRDQRRPPLSRCPGRHLPRPLRLHVEQFPAAGSPVRECSGRRPGDPPADETVTPTPSAWTTSNSRGPCRLAKVPSGRVVADRRLDPSRAAQESGTVEAPPSVDVIVGTERDQLGPPVVTMSLTLPIWASSRVPLRWPLARKRSSI